jgi:hypothetical protein
MKNLLFLLSLVVLPSTIVDVQGFIPSTTVANTKLSLLVRQGSAKIDSIAHELDELQNEKEMKFHSKHNHSTPKAKAGGQGFTYQESLVHKLRQAIHERDVLLRETLDELERAVQSTETAFEVAQIEHVQYEQEHKLYEEEHESIRKLLMQAVKLALRRGKNGVLFVLRFGRKKKE